MMLALKQSVAASSCPCCSAASDTLAGSVMQRAGWWSGRSATGWYLPGAGLRFSSEFWPDLVQSAECLVGECDLECAVALGDLLDGAGPVIVAATAGFAATTPVRRWRPVRRACGTESSPSSWGPFGWIAGRRSSGPSRSPARCFAAEGTVRVGAARRRPRSAKPWTIGAVAEWATMKPCGQHSSQR